MIQKTESIYHITHTFECDGEKHEATVVLKINYRSKSYDILPFKTNSSSNKFEFINNSSNWQTWFCVSKAIGMAIDFANEELRKIEVLNENAIKNATNV